MTYGKPFNRKMTSQTQAIPGSEQIRNPAEGFVWTLDRWSVLDRFLILGGESGTYYVNSRALTQENASNVLEVIRENGAGVVSRICEISDSGREPKNDPAIFALALCASLGNDKTRAAALQAMPIVCRTGTHLFQFTEVRSGLRGWGRGLRKSVENWYNAKSFEDLEYQAVKYKQREGWSPRDLLRLAHPVPVSEGHKALFKWIVDEEQIDPLPRVETMIRLQKTNDPKDAASIIHQSQHPREAVPTELLNHAIVWEALLGQMPMTGMIRNLATTTRVGLLTPGSIALTSVLEQLSNGDRIRKARVHPMAMLLAQRTYAAGKKGSGVLTSGFRCRQSSMNWTKRSIPHTKMLTQLESDSWFGWKSRDRWKYQPWVCHSLLARSQPRWRWLRCR